MNCGSKRKENVYSKHLLHSQRNKIIDLFATAKHSTSLLCSKRSHFILFTWSSSSSYHEHFLWHDSFMDQKTYTHSTELTSCHTGKKKVALIFLTIHFVTKLHSSLEYRKHAIFPRSVPYVLPPLLYCHPRTLLVTCKVAVDLWAA